MTQSLSSLETCGSFWLSVASTIAWPTLLALASFLYINVTIVYNNISGGKIETSTIFGVLEQRNVAPALLIDKVSKGSIGGVCCGSTTTSASSSDFYRSESGAGSLLLLGNGYPVRNFNWSLNALDATNASVQLVRRLLKRAVQEEEKIAWSKIILSSIGFAFGLVGLLRDPKSIPTAFKTMFIRSAIPDIRVFLLFSTVASLLGFFCGAFAGLVSNAPSARQATGIVGPALNLLWTLLCLASFGVGCWQVNERRVAKETVWPMFIYWSPAAVQIAVDCCGFSPLAILAMAGVVSGIIGENKIACHGLRA
jgi:hypothetical protein